MALPLIGITTHAPGAQHRAALDGLLALIVGAVERAGGLPLLIPPWLAAPALAAMLGRIDGLLLAGGGDLDPALYGAAHTAAIGGIEPERDQAELTLLRVALAAPKPVFGICRGAQILNVALGGTLYADTSEHPGALRHTYFPDHPLDLRPHLVQVAEGSRLAAIIGRPELPVNSLHHQACRSVAGALRVAATAPDGLVEAVELADHPFALAVQWHPEALPGVAEQRALFEAFVAACK